MSNAEIEVGKHFEITRRKPGRKRGTKTIVRVTGFYESPHLGHCVEVLDQADRKHYIPEDQIRNAKEVIVKHA